MTAITAAAATATANKNSNSNKTTAKATATASATASQQAFISIGWPLGTSVCDTKENNKVQLPWLAQWPFDRTPEIHVKAWVWKGNDSIQQNRKTDLTWEVVRSEPWDLSSFDNKDLGRLPMHLCPSRDRDRCFLQELSWCLEVMRSEPWGLSSFDNKDLVRLPMHLCASRDRCIHFR